MKCQPEADTNSSSPAFLHPQVLIQILHQVAELAPVFDIDEPHALAELEVLREDRVVLKRILQPYEVEMISLRLRA